ncbi:MAG: hypothetical protein AAGB14_09585 [Verrucomicrobiota bacterium]
MTSEKALEIERGRGWGGWVGQWQRRRLEFLIQEESRVFREFVRYGIVALGAMPVACTLLLFTKGPDLGDEFFWWVIVFGGAASVLVLLYGVLTTLYFLGWILAMWRKRRFLAGAGFRKW